MNDNDNGNAIFFIGNIVIDDTSNSFRSITAAGGSSDDKNKGEGDFSSGSDSGSADDTTRQIELFAEESNSNEGDSSSADDSDNENTGDDNAGSNKPSDGSDDADGNKTPDDTEGTDKDTDDGNKGDSEGDKPNRSELLSAPSDICNRVPVILADGIFVSSAADDAGVLEFRYIPQGSFSVAESSAVGGYANDRRISNFKVGENGHVSDESALMPNAVLDSDGNVTISNKAITLSVSKLAVETGTELPGNSLAVYAVDADGKESLVDSWVSVDEPHKLTAIAAGDYILKEEQAAEGYSIASPISFRVLDTAEGQSIAMENSAFGIGNIFDSMGQLGDAAPFLLFGLLIVGAAGLAYGVRRYRME